jgi:hypothetical protein
MEALFAVLPADLKDLSDDELKAALEDHKSRLELIKADDADMLGDLAEEEILTQMRAGVDAIKAMTAEQDARVEAHDNYVNAKNEIAAELEVKAESEEAAEEGEKPSEEAAEGEEAEVEAEAEESEASAETVEEKADERELVLASAEETTTTAAATAVVQAPRLRRPPAPAPERIAISEATGTALVAAGEMSYLFKEGLTPDSLAELIIASASHHGPHPKVDPVGRHRFGGPEHRVAHADFPFPEERTLRGGDIDGNMDKIRAVIVEGDPAGVGQYALTASGGLCAPLEPIYSMPNFAVDSEPVWDALPKFRADRGGVNVPTPTSIGDITTAISSISEANDALGGTFATKSCQDLDCPDYTEVAVQILAHCREYGNLNARAWPEKIAHENALTMAALARTTETFMLDRIKDLSIEVTQAEMLSTYADLVHALTKARSGIINRLRMANSTVFNVVIPEWIGNMLAADVAFTAFDRFQTQAAMIAHLESLGFRTVLYKDEVTGGTSQAFGAEAAGALDDYPDDVQWGIYPEGQFIGIDMGVLELGIVRDSTLNSTNDFQVFGERFRNLAMLGPAQGALWCVQGVCPNGELAAAATALTC